MSNPLFQCPRCHSDSTASFPMIYQGGTSTGNFSALSYGTNAGFIGTGGRTQSQSLLAQQTAPPRMEKRGFLYAFLSLIAFAVTVKIVFSFMSVISTAAEINIIVAIVFGAAAAGGILYLTNQVARKNKIIWRERIRDWESSWMCLKCGNRWYLSH